MQWHLITRKHPKQDLVSSRWTIILPKQPPNTHTSASKIVPLVCTLLVLVLRWDPAIPLLLSHLTSMTPTEWTSSFISLQTNNSRGSLYTLTTWPIVTSTSLVSFCSVLPPVPHKKHVDKSINQQICNRGKSLISPSGINTQTEWTVLFPPNHLIFAEENQQYTFFPFSKRRERNTLTSLNSILHKNDTSYLSVHCYVSHSKKEKEKSYFGLFYNWGIINSLLKLGLLSNSLWRI